MSQKINFLVSGHLVRRELPDQDVEVIEGVAWGNALEVFTPGYWLIQSWMSLGNTPTTTPYQTNDGLLSEIVFCLLGGYGITAELATAAYRECARRELISQQIQCEAAWFQALSAPLSVGSRVVHYRFPNKKSAQIARAMKYLREEVLVAADPLDVRTFLLSVPGIGYKTASWIVRNVYDCDRVAILDIHIQRAGLLCGLFNPSDKISTDYLPMETRFLEFAIGLGIRPAVLDCVIWEDMRAAGELPLRLLAQRAELLKNVRELQREVA